MLNRLPGLLLLLLSIVCFNVAVSQETGQDFIVSAADSLLDAGQYELAIGKYQAYINSFEKITDDERKTVADANGQIAFCYYKLDKYIEAIEFFQKALDLQREMGDMESVASTLNNIGLNYKMRGNYDKAIEYYEQTISIDEEMGKGNEIAKTLNNIGMVYRSWGKYDKAIEYLERSLRLKNNLDDQPGVSRSLNNIGLVYTEWKKYDQAILNFRESLKIEESLNNESDIALRLNNLGRVYFYLNQNDSALFYFNKTLLIYQRNNDKDQMALAFNNIGKVYLNRQKFEEAGYYLASALGIYDELGKEGEKATVLANLSDINRAMGNYAKSLQLLDSSTLIAESLNLRYQLQQNFQYYSDIYNDLKDYKKSLEYFKKYSSIKDSVFSDEILSKLSDFQIKYETEKKENEIELLKKTEVIQGLAFKKQTIQRNFMLVFSVLFLALAAMIFYSLQIKKKDNKIIAGEREKSDRLLLNILPAGIAQDLKEKGKTEPQLFESVTACFIDIVEFTRKSASIDPIILIGELNQIFTAFDNIIEKYGCERIKTIGDSYMAVAGLPDLNPKHAKQIVDSCLEMVRFMKKRNMVSTYAWEIRVGVHSGEVIAGVVGVKKYIYDVFGDTINTASRMESNSEPMKINISESTYQLIKDEYETEFRGELEARGKGKLRMYFVKA
jgi:adenylate cyclase